MRMKKEWVCYKSLHHHYYGPGSAQPVLNNMLCPFHISSTSCFPKTWTSLFKSWQSKFTRVCIYSALFEEIQRYTNTFLLKVNLSKVSVSFIEAFWDFNIQLYLKPTFWRTYRLSIEGYNLWSENTVFWEAFMVVSITDAFWDYVPCSSSLIPLWRGWVHGNTTMESF
jgi:hypothetical protein